MSDGCEVPGTSSSASPWPWQPQRTTQLHGDRSLPGPECGQESLRSLGRGGRRSTSSTPPHGDRSPVSLGAVAGRAVTGWHGRRGP